MKTTTSINLVLNVDQQRTASTNNEDKKPKFVRVSESDKQRILSSVTADTLINFFNDLTFIKKGKEYVCKESGGLAIAKKPDGWTVFNNSEKLDIPSGPLLTQICHKNRLNPKGNQADFLKMWKLAADFTGQFLDIETAEAPAAPSPKPKKEYKPQPYTPNDNGQKLKVSFTLEYAEENDEATKAVLSYFKRKINKPDLTTADLEKLGIKAVKASTNTTGYKRIYTKENLCFATVSGENIKLKFPNSPKGQRERYAQSKGNLLYGFDQLPKTGKALLFAAGQTDTTAINSHYNHLGIYAVCLNSETQTIPADLVEALRQRFDNVLTLFDNDKTGKQAAKKAAKFQGLPAVQLWDHTGDPQLNDVCDFINRVGETEFYKILCSEIDTRHAIKKEQNDPFSVAVPNALKLYIDKYLGEETKHGFSNCKPLDHLQRFIKKYKKLLLQSPTGTGKTTALLTLSFNPTFIKSIGAKRTIFFAPTTAIADQLQEKIFNDYGKNIEIETADQLQEKAFKFFGKKVKVIKEGYQPSDLDEADEVLICTYQSAGKVAHLVNDAFIVADECHTLTDWTFNNVANRYILEYAQRCKRAVLVSATPDLRLTLNVCPDFGFTLCKVQQNPNFAQRINIQPVYYTGTETDLLPTIEKLKTSDKTALIKKNNVPLLETFQKRINNKYGYKNFEIFSSKKRKHKEDNRHYQNIIKTGYLLEKTPEGQFITPPDYIGLTSLFDFGANFNNPIEQTFLINELSINSTRQISGRPRINYDTGKNKTVKTFVFRKADKDPEGKESPKFKKESTATAKLLEDTFQAWKATAAAANLHESFAENTLSIDKTELCPIYRSPITGKYEVNTIGLLQQEAQREQRKTSKEQFFKNLKKRFNNVKVLEPMYINIEHDEESQAIKKDLTETKKIEESQAFKILKDQDKNGKLCPLLEAVHQSTSDQQIKQKIKTVVKVKEPTPEALELLQTTPNLYAEGRFNGHLNHYFKLKKLAIPTDKILNILAPFEAKNADSTFKEFTNSLVCGIELSVSKTSPNRLSGLSMERVKKYKAILIEFQRFYFKPLNKWQILKLMKQATGDQYLTEVKAVKKLKELFTIEQQRENYNDPQSGKVKKRTAYLIVSRNKPFEILDRHGIPETDYLNGLLNQSIGCIDLEEIKPFVKPNIIQKKRPQLKLFTGIMK